MSTEFKDYKIGAAVMPYEEFSGDEELRRFVKVAYPNYNDLKFDPTDWPQR